ncbi:hypothetical protein GCM10007916_34020 [Psychromonas marina]|uniref:EF-hand domain-containing protein n=2 Tax=Psychromonas marina TaxID=88364 RepID=A0ABQ6E4S3_9GAMM|nr:hypothetical protein GCM10007916_34020 [Psychromonas marina]
MIALILSGSTLLNIASAQEQLTATIIGSGSPVFNENRASAGVLVSVGDTKILVDMGNGTQANLNKLGIRIRDLSGLFFTHHHLDHNEEFVPIFIQSLMGGNKFTVVGPPNTVKLSETNLVLYEEDIAYRLGKTKRTIEGTRTFFDARDLTGGESFTVGDINISTLEVPHAIHTVAYRFDYDDQSVVITGDLTYSEALPAFAKNADYMIIDSGGMIMKDARNRKKNSKNSPQNGQKKSKNPRTPAHLNLDDSSSIAQQAKVKNLIYTHFNSTLVDTEASLEEIRKIYSGNVVFAEDLMVINNAHISASRPQSQFSYQIVDTGQKKFYGNDDVISLPREGDAFYGQDATYTINDPSYSDNNDGTITDNVTGLMWQKELGEKITFEQAQQKIESYQLAGFNDWRIATLKEAYSLIQFTGTVKGETALTPFIDTQYFEQPLGGANPGEREIDAQIWTSTEYVGKTMNNDETVFGVNFVDGRIKGYPKYNPRTKQANKMYFRFVRGNEDYGNNSFVDNGDATITDQATGLMWQQADSGKGLNWQQSLAYAENLTLAGHDDWRLPNAKELQSIVDYTRSPETSNSAAIDPIFEISSIKNEGGEIDYPYYWSSTTHLDGPVPESGAVYVAFGKALGEMHGVTMDVHGAGSQRSDPKTGEPMSRGPQGDMIRVDNYVRVVRGGDVNIPMSVVTEKVSQYSQSEQKGQTSKQQKSNKPQRKIGGTNNKFITRLDKNGDGKVSKSEFKGNAARFKQFDKNNDGYITADEAPTGPPSGERKKNMQ